MATVRMQKGDKYADIFDSPETIAQAEKDGYVKVAVEKKAEKVVEADSTEETAQPVKQSRRAARQ